MTTRFDTPKFGPIDADGFSTVSYYIDGAEALKVSVNLDRYRNHLAKTANNLENYSADEQESLRTGATIIAAREEAPTHDPESTLETILAASSSHIAESLVRYFPLLAFEALKVASNTCVKHTLNQMAQAMRAPRIYKEEFADALIKELRSDVQGLLEIGAGRPAETAQRFRETRKALAALNNSEPTQEKLSEELNIDPRTLRTWLEGVDLTYKEWLRACSSDEAVAAGN